MKTNLVSLHNYQKRILSDVEIPYESDEGKEYDSSSSSEIIKKSAKSTRKNIPRKNESDSSSSEIIKKPVKSTRKNIPQENESDSSSSEIIKKPVKSTRKNIPQENESDSSSSEIIKKPVKSTRKNEYDSSNNEMNNKKTKRKQNPNKKTNQFFFIDEDDEKEHINEGEIGSGSTSVTYKIYDKKNKRVMCKKVIKHNKRESTIKDAQNALKEFEVMYNIDHPCICKAIGINMVEPIEINEKGKKQKITTIAIFLEYLNFGLNEILENPIINNTLKTKIVLEIIHGMRYIHFKGMIHRDLKIENIMVNSILEAKLVDFGLVRINEITQNNFSFVEDSLTKGIGTFAYMSPEMVNEDDYDEKTDVYSFGVVLYVIFVGSIPKQNLKDKIHKEKVNLPSPSSSISEFCIDLISKCLSPSPSLRPSFDEILNLLRKNSYSLASEIDVSILSKRDSELDEFKIKI